MFYNVHYLVDQLKAKTEDMQPSKSDLIDDFQISCQSLFTMCSYKMLIQLMDNSHKENNADIPLTLQALKIFGFQFNVCSIDGLACLDILSSHFLNKVGSSVFLVCI